MKPSRFCSALLYVAFGLLAFTVGAPVVRAQVDGGNGNQQTGNIGGAAGVEVDATGVLRTRFFRDPSGQLTRQRLQQMRASLPPEITRPSKMRKVSLNRLERVLARRLAAGGDATADMKHLAGLTRLQYVFYYPETQDIVIAGPAEGYGIDLAGRAIGLNSGRAILLLEDLIVALRSFAPGARPTKAIGCSIDPTPEGLQRMQQYMVAVSRRVSPRHARRYAAGLRENLGLQMVSIHGVSPRSHFAQVLVEADYRMKLIGIGLENPAVRITSYIQRARPASVSRNALQRWYFVPNYDSVTVSEDMLAMELEGEGIKLIGENEFVRADGSRAASNVIDRASEMFVRSFTKQYARLAARSPVFAQLRNLIDMSIAAAYIQQEDFYSQASWELGVFAKEDIYPVETAVAPQKVESAVNVVWKGNTLMTPIGGGVNIDALKTLSSNKVRLDEDGNLVELQTKADANGLAADQWWWD